MSEKKPSTSKADGPFVTASVLLLIESDVLERVPKAVHLRTAGFNVVEAADGEEARRVIDSVTVNIVIADLAMPDQMKGLAFLRWLRLHHPAAEAIVTSDTETNMPPEGYGMFLSKPYRLADLDYCLQKVLAIVRMPASETGGAMTADLSREANPAPGKAQPGSVQPNGPPASDEADARDADVSKPSIAELSRRLAERAARQRAVDPAAVRTARRAALDAYDRTRARRQRLVLGLAAGAIACSSIIYLVPTPDSRVAPSPSAALPEPALLLAIAVATPIPALPDPASPSPAPSPSPAINVAYVAAFVPAAVQAARAADSQQALAEMAPSEAPLRRDEAREVQARLRSFGFNPGPVDGDPGAMTEGAIRRYQQNRGQPQTGKVDRELLEQLRHDPAPKIVQRTTGTLARPLRPNRTVPIHSNPYGLRAIGSASGWTHGCAKAPAPRSCLW
jgi:peptidoglycan hydrolase-like protein with peptidoglycan-binding domain/DNA-binding NarL/FixJ family response regulator